MQLIQQFDVLGKSLLSRMTEAMSLPATAFDPVLELVDIPDEEHRSLLQITHHHSLGDCQDCGVYNAATRTAPTLDYGLLTLVYADVDQKIQFRAIDTAALVLSIEQLCALVYPGETHSKLGKVLGSTHVLLWQVLSRDKGRYDLMLHAGHVGVMSCETLKQATCGLIPSLSY